MADRLLTAQEVAEVIGMRAEYVWQLARNDQIPHLRFGRNLRFRAVAVTEWLRVYERGSLGGEK